MHIIVTGPNGRQYDGEVEGDHLVEALAQQVAKQAGVPADTVSSLFLCICVSVYLCLSPARALSLSDSPSLALALSP